QRGPPVDEAVRDVHGRRTYCWPLAAARSLHQAPATLRAVPGDLQEVEALLRAHGGRSTPARRAVIRALLAADDHHVTAPELLAAIRQDDPGFQESSLYRTLDRLVALEVVHELHLGPGRTV